MADNAHRTGKNGKSHVTAEQLKEAISMQEEKCNTVFKECFARLDSKLDKITETLGYVNTMLSERLSNHAVRLGSVENALAKAKRDGFI